MEHPDYTQTLHTRENNSASQAHLDANKFHFVGQCAYVLSLLQKGVVLTTREALLHHNIGDLRRRLKDLKDAGVKISEDWVLDENGKKTRYKKWFISQNENVYAPGVKTLSDFAKDMIKATQAKLL